MVARGHVGDRPFSRTIFAIGARGFSGELLLEEAGRRYRVAWRDGAAIAADSPAPADAPTRLAAAAGLIDRVAVADVVRAMKERPAEDPLTILLDVAKLAPARAAVISKRAFAQAALRPFALENARFTLLTQTDLQPRAECTPLDCRWLILHGILAHYSSQRVASELGAVVAGSFRLSEAGHSAAAAFGFGEQDRLLLAALRSQQHNYSELVELDLKLDRYRVGACLLALAACGYLEMSATPNRAAARASRDTLAPPPGARANPASDLQAETIRTLIRTKQILLDRDASHFELLELGQDASSDDVRAAYFALAKQLHPDRLRAAGIADLGEQAHRVFAQINKAFATLSDASKRAAYEDVLRAGGEKAVRAQQAAAEELAERIFAAEEAFLRGEMALRRRNFSDAMRELQRAIELNPEEGEHYAYLGWARWCSQTEKNQPLAAEVEAALKKAIELSPMSPTGYLFRGRVAKQLGNSDTAAECFRKVVELRPDEREAQVELRLLEKEDDKKGLLGRFRRS